MSLITSKKYLMIFKNTWDEYSAYRINFVFWRVRVVLRFLITYFLWSAIYSSQQNYFGYNRQSMLSYVLLTYLVSNFVFATRTQDIGSEINEGRLTNYLLRPINYFTGLIARDISDKFINFIFTVVEFVFLLNIFQPPIFFQTNFNIVVFSIIGFLGSIVIYFYISILLGFIGFWSAEIWGIRFIFMVLLDFFAGTLFPIDILPAIVTKILLFTPFPYMFYFPIKIYLGRLSLNEIILGFGVLCTWIFLLKSLVMIVWNKGLRIYSAEGR